MAYLPLNLFFAALFILGIIWGWEGEEERQFFAVISSLAMFPLWLAPLYNIVETGGVVSITRITGWLPTFIIFWILWWNVALMYFTGAHLMGTLGREEPLGKGLKRLRKQA